MAASSENKENNKTSLCRTFISLFLTQWTLSEGGHMNFGHQQSTGGSRINLKKSCSN